jgi:hypothetical protein
MATTTNYGWTTPDDTALVKDGAAAIRTLGSSIDSTLKTQIDAQIPDSLLTTTGDIIYASGASTPARLGIGSSGQSLVVSGGLPVWSTPSSGSMTSIASGSLSSTSVTISSISGIYKNLYLIVTSPQVNTGATELGFRFNANTGSNYQFFGGSLSTAGWGSGLLSHYFIDMQSIPIPTTANNNVYTVEIQDYASATYHSIEGSQRTSAVSGGYNGWCNFNSAAAITSITIKPANGTSTFTAGTYILYGVN